MTISAVVRKPVGQATRSMTRIAALIAAALLSTTVTMADCVPTTCAAAGKTCGTIDNGCGGSINCGSCTWPQTCGGGGVENVCGPSARECVPTTCAAAGKNCGTIDNGCGGKVICGSCAPPLTCGGGGAEGVCGTPERDCVPTTCAAQGKTCGTIDNGCGGKISCGSCTPPLTCGGGGVENVCGPPARDCVPTTCTAAGKNCGTIDNGCGGRINCGSCTWPLTCGYGGVANVCGPSAPRTTVDLNALAARGEVIANEDPLAVELRNREAEGPGRRGFDIGMAAAEGHTLPGPGKQKIHDQLSLAEQWGFNTAVRFSLERNRNAVLAAKGAAIAKVDPIVAEARRYYGRARTVESDGFYRLGFDIATGIFGDPALGAQGHTATGPGSMKTRNGLSIPAQRGFDASVAFHLSRGYAH